MYSHSNQIVTAVRRRDKKLIHHTFQYHWQLHNNNYYDLSLWNGIQKFFYLFIFIRLQWSTTHHLRAIDTKQQSVKCKLTSKQKFYFRFFEFRFFFPSFFIVLRLVLFQFQY